MEKNLINVTCVVSSLYGTGAFQVHVRTHPGEKHYNIILCDTCGVGIVHCKSQYSYGRDCTTRESLLRR